MIRFCVTGTPVPQSRPRFANGHAYEPAVCRDYKRAVAAMAKTKMADCGPLTGPVEVELNFYFPIPKSWSLKKKDEARAGWIMPTKRPDCDNLAKAVLDAMNGVVYGDDSQVVRLMIDKRYDDEARVEVYADEMN